MADPFKVPDISEFPTATELPEDELQDLGFFLRQAVADPNGASLSQPAAQAVGVNPDEYAADEKLAKQQLLPPNSISNDTRQVYQDLSMQQNIEADSQGAPTLRELLRKDAGLVRMASDDIPNLAQFERVSRDLTVTGAFGGGVDILQGLGWRFVEVVGELTNEDLEAFAQRNAELNFADASDNGIKQKFMDIGDDPAKLWKWMKQSVAEQLPMMAPFIIGGIGGFFVAGPIGAAVGAFIPGFIMGTGGVQNAIKEIDPDTEAPFTAMFGGTLVAALDSWLPGRIGSLWMNTFGKEATKKAFKQIAIKVAVRSAAVQGGKGMLVEGVTEAIQEVIEATVAASATGTEVDQEALLEQTIEAFAVGTLMGLGTTATFDLVKSRRVNKLIEHQDKLTRESKLQERNGTLKAGVTSAQMQAGGVQEVFLPVDVLIQFVNQHPKGADAALAELGVTGTLENAIEIGQDVAISLEAFSQVILGSDGFKILSPYLKVSRDTKSVAEVAEEIAADEELQAELLADIEAYDTTQELKERVASTIQNMSPKVLAEATNDEFNILTDLIHTIADRKIDVAPLVRKGRLTRLDEEISVLDKTINKLNQDIEAREKTGEVTVDLNNKLNTALASKEDLQQQQQDITLPASPEEHVVPAGGVADATDTAIIKLEELQAEKAQQDENLARAKDRGAPNKELGQIKRKRTNLNKKIKLAEEELAALDQGEVETIAPTEPAALRTETGEIFTGQTHAEAAIKARKAGAEGILQNGFFITTTGRLVTREEALALLDKNDPAVRRTAKRGDDSLDAMDFTETRSKQPSTKTEALAKKKITTTGQKLHALSVKSGVEILRAFKLGVRAGLKVGKALTARKKAINKAIRAIPEIELSTKQKLAQTGRINDAGSEKALNRIVQDVSVRIEELIVKNHINELTKAINDVASNTKAKVRSGRKIGKLHPESQNIMDTVRKVMKMTKEEAEIRLAEMDAKVTQGFYPESATVLERQLIAVRLNNGTISMKDTETLLLDLKEVREFGEAQAANRALTKQRNTKKAILRSTKEVIGDGTPAEQLDGVSLWSRIKREAKDLQTSFASSFNGWDEILDIMFTDDALIQSLRITVEIQKQKARSIRWKAELTEITKNAYGLTTEQQVHDKHVADAENVVNELFEKEGGGTTRLSYNLAQIRKLYMERLDPTLIETIAHKDGNAMTGKMQDALFDHLLPQDYVFINAQMDLYQKWYKQINTVHRRVFGTDMTFNEFYSPIVKDQSFKEPGDKIDGMSSFIMDERTFRKQLPSQLKEREPNLLPLKKRSDVGAMGQYIQDMTWFIEGSEKVLHMKSVMGDKGLQGEIDAKHGASMNKFINMFLEDFGVGYAARSTVAEEYFGTFNKLFSGSVLGLKGTIGTKQLVSWFAMADGVPTIDFLRAHADFFKNPAKIIRFMYANSALIQHRGNSQDFELAKIGKFKEPLFGPWQRTKVKGVTVVPASNQWEAIKFAFIKFGDRVPIYAGGWAKYQYALKQGKSHKEAIQIMEDGIATTQQSTDIDKLSALQRSGALGRTLTLFMTARLALLRGELRAIRHVRSGKITWREFGKRIAYYHVIMPMMIQYIASGFEWDEDRQAVAAILGQLNSLVILGDMMTYMVESVVGADRPFTSNEDIPFASMLRDVNKGILDAMDSGNADELIDAALTVGGALGTATGQPLDQMGNIIGGFLDILDGDFEKGLKRIWGFSEKVAEESSR